MKGVHPDKGRANRKRGSLRDTARCPAEAEPECRGRAILDAVKNPLNVKDVVKDALGRLSQRYIGREAEVVLNPETGQVISVNPTSSAKAARLLGGE